MSMSVISALHTTPMHGEISELCYFVWKEYAQGLGLLAVFAVRVAGPPLQHVSCAL